MAISEEGRHRLYRRLEEVLGAAEATTLMSHLPPVGWADVATKQDLLVLRHDLGALEDKISARTDRMEHRLGDRIAGLELRMEREMRAMTWRLVTVIIAALGVAVASVHL